MPLPERKARRLRERVTARLPPRHMTLVNAMGGTRTLVGYVKESAGPLDALGLPDYDATLVMAPDEGPVTPGDELDDLWVVWAAAREGRTWRTARLRRRLPFDTWTREREVAAGRDPVTRAPLWDVDRNPVDAHLYRASLSGEVEDGRIQPGGTADLVLRGPADLVRLGDVLTHPLHGRYLVRHAGPYGPWTLARLEAM